MLERRRSRTKILATLGPASDSPARLRDLIHAGADAFRLNASHADDESLRQTLRRIHRIRRELGRSIATLVDLRGPRIRLGVLPEPRVLKTGEEVVLAPGRRAASGVDLPVDYRRLLHDLQPGQRVLLRDGTVELRVLTRRSGRLRARVVRGGPVASNHGVNLPDSRVSAPALSSKDRRDLRAAVEGKADWVALSFVRSAADVRAVRRALDRLGGDLPVMAKIEHPSALEHLDEILEVADAVMVARGDLAVEVGHAGVPTLQKHIVRRAIECAKPVVVATQMLESMIEHPQPTRAEVSDVANAALDGVDAVMLSGETAIGAWPVEAVRCMREILTKTEEGQYHHGFRLRPALVPRGTRRDARVMPVVHAAVELCERAEARLLLAFTESGRSARLTAAFRARPPLVALTFHETVYHRMALYWGTLPGRLPRVRRIREMHREAARLLREHRLLRGRDLLVATTGTFAVSGATNTIQLVPLDQLG